MLKLSFIIIWTSNHIYYFIITSFGHSLIHGAIIKSHTNELLKLFMETLDITEIRITANIIISFIISLIMKPKN